MKKKYLEVLKFRLYPTKEQRAKIDNEIRFYQRYKIALFREINKKKVSSIFELSESDLNNICDDYKKIIRKSKFDFSKYYANNHFAYAKDNVIKSIIYKKKKNIKRYPIDRVTIKVSDSSCYLMYGHLYMKNGLKIKVKPYVETLENVSFINLTRTNGIYFISVARFLDVIKGVKTNKACGIDIGFSSFLTIYDTDDNITKVNFDNAKIDRLISKVNFYKRTLCHLEIVNPNYLKSKNYFKVLHKLENLYEKIACSRSYFFNDLANKLVSKYDLIVVEQIAFESLFRQKESKLNLQKNSFGTFFKVLEEKAKKYSKQVIRADRFYMSSQICSECGLINNNMKDTSKREFVCECGFKIDRDANAARNLLMYGLKKIRNETFKKEEVKVNRGERTNY